MDVLRAKYVNLDILEVFPFRFSSCEKYLKIKCELKMYFQIFMLSQFETIIIDYYYNKGL